MGAEIMREIGVLLVVFAPLDALFARETLTIPGMAVIVVLAVSFIVAGLLAGVER